MANTLFGATGPGTGGISINTAVPSMVTQPTKKPRGSAHPHIPQQLLGALNDALNPNEPGRDSIHQILEAILKKNVSTAIELMVKANPEDFSNIQNVVGPLLFPEGLKKWKEKPIELKEVVKVSFNETTFQNRKEKIDNLEERAKDFRTSTLKKATEAAGDNMGLESLTASSIHTVKENASQKLDDYICTYNSAAEIQTAFKGEQEELQKLKLSTLATIAEFRKHNEQRIQHLKQFFKVVVDEHGLLKAKADFGYEPLTTRVYGNNIVKMPGTQLKDKYNPPKESISTENGKNPIDHTNFSAYFGMIHEGYGKYELFVQKVQKHINKVAGCRKTLMTSDPEMAKTKKASEELRRQYEELHDACVDMLILFQQYNDELSGLEKYFSKLIEQYDSSLSSTRKGIVTQMRQLFDQHKNLDEKLKENKTKTFKIFTLDTTEPHDAQK